MLGRSSGNHDWLLANASDCVWMETGHDGEQTPNREWRRGVASPSVRHVRRKNIWKEITMTVISLSTWNDVHNRISLSVVLLSAELPATSKHVGGFLRFVASAGLCARVPACVNASTVSANLLYRRARTSVRLLLPYIAYEVSLWGVIKRTARVRRSHVMKYIVARRISLAWFFWSCILMWCVECQKPLHTQHVAFLVTLFNNWTSQFYGRLTLYLSKKA